MVVILRRRLLRITMRSFLGGGTDRLKRDSFRKGDSVRNDGGLLCFLSWSGEDSSGAEAPTGSSLC